MKESKEAYDEGKEALSKNDYTGAMASFGKVSKNDVNYQEAQKQSEEAKKGYLKTVYDQAEVYLKANKFDQAIGLYNKAKQVVDVSKLDTKIEAANQLKAEYKEQEVKQKEAEAEEYRNNGEFLNAITVYKKLYSETSDNKYNVLSEAVQDEWIDNSIKTAEAYLADGYKCDEAKAEMIRIKNALGEKSVIMQELDRIDSFRPADVMKMDAFNWVKEWDTVYDLSEWDCKANTGETYNNGLWFWNGKEWWGNDTGSVVRYDILIEGKYDLFSGKLFVDSIYKSTKSKCHFNVYSDDVLVYSSDTLAAGTLPFDFEVSVEGAKVFSFEYVLDEANNDIGVGLANPCLRKEYKKPE